MAPSRKKKVRKSKPTKKLVTKAKAKKPTKAKKLTPKKPAKKPAPKKQVPQKAKPKLRGKRKPKPKPVFESRSRADEIPEGFDINLGDVTQDEAYATIQARLEDTKADLPEGFGGRVLMHAYADGSVDGELYVIVPEGTYHGTAAWALNEAMGNVAVGKNYWMSTGARFAHRKGEEWYRKHRGLNQVETNYQRAVSANIPEENLILRKKLLTGMKEKYGREAHSVFVRLHWNPEGKQPKRDTEGK